MGHNGKLRVQQKIRLAYESRNDQKRRRKTKKRNKERE